MIKPRIIALDVGERRIGVAVSDPLGYTAQGLGTILRRSLEYDLDTVASHVEAYEARRLLVGLPRTMAGDLAFQAQKTLDFIEALRARGFQVDTWDERLSTASARRTLIEGGVSRRDRKAVIDKLAACVILQSYLDSGGLDRPDAYRLTGKEVFRMTEGVMEPDNVVELVDENDNLVRFEHLMTVEHEGAAYALLVPIDPVDEVDEDEVVILRIEEGADGEDTYVGVEDDALLEAVFEKYLEIAEDDDEEDDDQDEGPGDS